MRHIYPNLQNKVLVIQLIKINLELFFFFFYSCLDQITSFPLPQAIKIAETNSHRAKETEQIRITS